MGTGKANSLCHSAVLTSLSKVPCQHCYTAAGSECSPLSMPQQFRALLPGWYIGIGTPPHPCPRKQTEWVSLEIHPLAGGAEGLQAYYLTWALTKERVRPSEDLAMAVGHIGQGHNTGQRPA